MTDKKDTDGLSYDEWGDRDVVDIASETMDNLRNKIKALEAKVEAKDKEIKDLKARAKGVADRHEMLLDKQSKEIEYLHAWKGLMSLLDEHWPEDVIDGTSGDAGPKLVVALRKIADKDKEIEELKEIIGDPNVEADKSGLIGHITDMDEQRDELYNQLEDKDKTIERLKGMLIKDRSFRILGDMLFDDDINPPYPTPKECHEMAIAQIEKELEGG